MRCSLCIAAPILLLLLCTFLLQLSLVGSAVAAGDVRPLQLAADGRPALWQQVLQQAAGGCASAAGELAASLQRLALVAEAVGLLADASPGASSSSRQAAAVQTLLQVVGTQGLRLPDAAQPALL